MNIRLPGRALHWYATALAFLLVAQLLGGFGQWANGQSTSPPGRAVDPLVATFSLTRPTAYPLAITTDRSGNVWLAEDNTDALVEYFPSNSTFLTFDIPTQRHLAWIWFLVPDANGNLWFSDESQSLLWRFSPSTKGFANFTAGGAFPLALSYDEARGRIWFTSLKTNQVGYFEISGGSASLGRLVNFTAPLPGSGVAGIVADPAGDVFVAESFQAKIVELDGNTLTAVRTWSLPAGSEPVGLALDGPRGRLWFTNHASSFFGYVGLNSSGYAEYPTSLLFEGDAYTVTLPYWIGVSARGYVWFDEHFANRIARFDPSNLQLTEFNIPTNNSSPLRFALDDGRGAVWFTEFEGNAIGRVWENSSLAQEVAVGAPMVSVGPTATVGVSSSPATSPPAVSVSSSISGATAPGFRVATQPAGDSFQVTFTDNQARPGDYSAALCFEYPGLRQCGYVLLVVPAPQSGLLMYGVYAALGGVAAVVLLQLRREYRRDRGRLAPPRA